MFTIRTTLKKDKNTEKSEKEVATSVEAFDHYREACVDARDKMKAGLIDDFFVELIPGPRWHGVLSYQCRFGRD